MIEITFSNSINEVSAFGLTQWDKGQKLKIIWNNLPANFQVHFASRNSSEAIVVNAKAVYGSSVVEIPDELLKNSADIYAWIYATEGDKIGESIKKAVLYVNGAKEETAKFKVEIPAATKRFCIGGDNRRKNSTVAIGCISFLSTWCLVFWLF